MKEEDGATPTNDKPVTPVNRHILALRLKGYDKIKTSYLLKGFITCFKLGFVGIQKVRMSTNLRSALENPHVVSQKLEIEKQNRIAGPFNEIPLPNFSVSPIGLVSKKQPGKFRIIHHLSYPASGSINDSIPDSDATVHYASTDDAISVLNKLGPGCVLSKVDIQSAFKIIPVHPEDHNLLGFKWEGKFYYDRTLPMGCRSSCAIFETFSTAVEWIAKGIINPGGMVHILDDFLIISTSMQTGQQNLERFQNLCEELGIPLAPDKTAGPSTCLTFAGIELDTCEMSARLPTDKLEKAIKLVSETLTKTNCDW